MTTRRRVLAAASILAIGAGVTACGSEGVSQKVRDDSPNVSRGAELFAQRCAGCHTMDLVGAQGGATQIRDRERVDGPNFNVRRENRDSVLYAIRNGGFSGAIMPENIVVGNDANDIAAFLAKYAGSERKTSDITPASQPEAGGGGGSNTTSTQGTTSTPTTSTQDTTSTPEANTQGTTSTPEANTQGTTSTPEANTTTNGAGNQQASAQGKQVFTQNCGGCHTLKDAGTSGSVGPNLDDLKPDQATAQRQVTNGGGGMPAFKGQLSDAQIKAVAQYVSSVAGKS
jgi:mono/diheme cytochrome c family protein